MKFNLLKILDATMFLIAVIGFISILNEYLLTGLFLWFIALGLDCAYHYFVGSYRRI